MFIRTFVVGSERQMRNVKKTRNSRSRSVQGHPRSLIFGTNRKRSYGFLLVFNSNLGRFLHRFRDTAAYRSKNRKNRPFEPPPFSQIALAGGDPLRIFRRVISRLRVKSWGYQMVKNLDASSLRFDTIPAVTDGRTDTLLSQIPRYAWRRAGKNSRRVPCHRPAPALTSTSTTASRLYLAA